MSLLRRAMQAVRNAAARWTTITLSSETADYEVTGLADIDGEPPGQDPAAMVQHYGLRSRPRPGSTVLTIPVLAAAGQRAIIGSETPGAGPLDQEEGEVELYAQFGQRIRLRSDGGMILEVESGAAAQVRADGSVLLVDSGGGVARMENRVLTIADDVVARDIRGRDIARRHDLGTGAAPATVVSALATAASPGTTVVSVTGTDRMFRVTLTVGANDISAGVELFVSTFGASLAGAMAQVTAEDGGKCGATASTTQVTVKAGETLTTATTHVFVVSTGGVA